MTPRRHYVVPDLQMRPGVPLDHLDWIAQDIVRRKPDVIVQIGDAADFASLSTHSAPGSMSKEGARYEADVEVANEGFRRLTAPIHAEIARCKRRHLKRWEPRMVFTTGNHEHRVQRRVESDPVWAGTIRDTDFAVESFGFERHPFLKPVEIDSVHYAHFFQSEKSDRPIGGTMENRLNKIGVTFVVGHEQGLLLHRRPLPVGKTIHGIVAGSCYLHAEEYRGAQRNNEWRGTVCLNDVRDGDLEPMPLTLRYLCRTYAGEELVPYMNKRYPGRDWSYLDR